MRLSALLVAIKWNGHMFYWQLFHFSGSLAASYCGSPGADFLEEGGWGGGFHTAGTNTRLSFRESDYSLTGSYFFVGWHPVYIMYVAIIVHAGNISDDSSTSCEQSCLCIVWCWRGTWHAISRSWCRFALREVRANSFDIYLLLLILLLILLLLLLLLLLPSVVELPRAKN